MGHERVGFLPKTNKWRNIVSSLPNVQNNPESTTEIANRVLDLVNQRYASIYADKGVQAAFGFLIGLVSSQNASVVSDLIPGVKVSSDTSIFDLTNQSNRWIDKNVDSMEYGEIAKRVCGEVIAKWQNEHDLQRNLLSASGSESTADIWASAYRGDKFSEISRLFFSRFTNRYLNYFLERETASGMTIRDKSNLKLNLENSINQISTHAFETSKITQSFAAGWFNKNVKAKDVELKSIQNFLKIAFAKMREELRREATINE